MLRLSKIYSYFLFLSAGLVILAIILISAFGLRLGIDFRGGTLIELSFTNSIHAEQLHSSLRQIEEGEYLVQSTAENRFIIKTSTLEPDQLLNLKDQLRKQLGDFEELRTDSVGPTIGKELLNKAYWQVVLVSIAIVFYIAYAFRKIKKNSKENTLSSWKLGSATIFALIHDLVITLGLFAFLGRYLGVEIDSLFVTALLTILGFSVHDTIVVFDRLRENLQKHPHKDFASILDYSVNQTLSRSINTSSTLIFVLIAMMLFGGESVFYFVTAILIGVISGTYSSIFIASPTLLIWQSRNKT